MVGAQEDQEMGDRGFANAWDRLQEIAAWLEVRIVVDALVDFVAGFLQLLVQGFQQVLDRGSGRVVSGVEAVLLHLAHFQSWLDAAHEGLKFTDDGRGRSPPGRLPFLAVAGHEPGIGGVGLGPAPFALGQGFDLGGVDHADRKALIGEKLGQGEAISAGGFHDEQHGFVPKSHQPRQQGGESDGIILKHFLAIFAVTPPSDLEFLLGYIDTDHDFKHNNNLLSRVKRDQEDSLRST
jgi:hypothetical protein